MRRYYVGYVPSGSDNDVISRIYIFESKNVAKEFVENCNKKEERKGQIQTKFISSRDLYLYPNAILYDVFKNAGEYYFQRLLGGYALWQEDI